jgi:hypothetical protein
MTSVQKTIGALRDQRAYKIHYDVGRKVRDTIESFGGTMPEDLAKEEDIKKLERRKRLLIRSGRSWNNGKAHYSSIVSFR